MANSGFLQGMNVQAGQWYDATFYARTEGDVHTGLCFSLESSDGSKTYTRCTIPEVGGQWTKYSVSLQSRGTEVPKGSAGDRPHRPFHHLVRLHLPLPARKTFKDRLPWRTYRLIWRKMLSPIISPRISTVSRAVASWKGLRFKTVFRWADSIGDISQRAGGFDLWGYYNTYGLGFEGISPTHRRPAGSPMRILRHQLRHKLPGEIAAAARKYRETMLICLKYVQDSMDALEYGSSPTTSPARHAKRAPPTATQEPFKINVRRDRQ